jgi:hypothetical protein
VRRQPTVPFRVSEAVLRAEGRPGGALGRGFWVGHGDAGAQHARWKPVREPVGGRTQLFSNRRCTMGLRMRSAWLWLARLL